MSSFFACDCACAAAPAAPDYSSIAQSNEKSAQIAADSAANDLAFRKQQYQDALPYQKSLADLATKVAQQQLSDSKTAQDRSTLQWEDYAKTYQPVEHQVVNDAMGAQYLSPLDAALLRKAMRDGDSATVQALTQKAQESQIGQRNADLDKVGQAQLDQLDASGQIARARAIADSEQATATARDSTNRNLMSLGVNPNSGKFLAAQGGINLGAAASKVGTLNTINNQDTLSRVGIAGSIASAKDQAKQGIIANNQSLRSGVANFGRNMPNTSAQQVGISTNSGNSAVSNSGTAATSWLPAATYVSGAVPNTINAAQVATQGTLGLGGLMSSNYNAQLGYTAAMNQAQMNQGGGAGQFLGTLAGAALTKWSDVRLKKNVMRVGSTARGLGIYIWEWIWGGFDKGVLAQEVEKIIPEAVVTGPDGWKRVNYGLVG